MNTRKIKILIAGLLSIICCFNLSSQIDTMALKTPEGVCAKMLEFISFEKDEVKDWDEYRNLFLPNALKMSFRVQEGESISRQARAQNIEEFVRYWGPGYPEKGFEEYVIGVEVNEFNGIATVFQSFYCKTLDGSYEARGVNSYQVVFLNNRWWIVSSMFINESDDNKLPDELLFAEYKSNIHDLTSDSKVKSSPEYKSVYQAIENYVLAYYEVDTSKIRTSVDPAVRKVGYWHDIRKNERADNLELTYEGLIKGSGIWNRPGNKADENSIRSITIYDIGEKIAAAKIEAVWGMDYFHLSKVDGTWKIKNVIWEGKG